MGRAHTVSDTHVRTAQRAGGHGLDCQDLVAPIAEVFGRERTITTKGGEDMKRLFKCDDCGLVMPEKAMEDVGDLDVDFLYPGAIIPSGRCPKGECGAGCYPLLLDLANRKVLKAIQAAWDALSDMVEEPIGPRKSSGELEKACSKAIEKLSKAIHTDLHNT